MGTGCKGGKGKDGKDSPAFHTAPSSRRSFTRWSLPIYAAACKGEVPSLSWNQSGAPASMRS